MTIKTFSDIRTELNESMTNDSATWTLLRTTIATTPQDANLLKKFVAGHQHGVDHGFIDRLSVGQKDQLLKLFANLLILLADNPTILRKTKDAAKETVKEATVTTVQSKESSLIGKTIVSQINGLDKHALTAWGAKNFITTNSTALPNNKVIGPGIQFDVRGGKFKGRILIGLNSYDLYDIALLRIMTTAQAMMNNSVVRVASYATDIGVENLVTYLDSVIG